MSSKRYGLVDKARDELARRFLDRKSAEHATQVPPAATLAGSPWMNVPEAFGRFDRFPGYERLLVLRAAADRLGLANPFFKTHDGVAGATTQIEGRRYVNFSSYNYLGLNGDARVNTAAEAAIERYGTSVSASRLVAGERPVAARTGERARRGLRRGGLRGVRQRPCHQREHDRLAVRPEDLILHDA